MKFIADALSLLRLLLAGPVIYLSLHGEWKWAFAVLALGWATDLLDGIAARKFGSLRNRWPSLDSDGIADSVMAFGASLVPVLYAGSHLGWTSRTSITLDVLYAMTLISGALMVFIMPSSRAVIAVNMIVFHGALQICGTLLWFGYMAGGLPLMLITGVVMGFVATAQTPKMKLWYRGAFQ